jgi:hypothetical protein
MFLSWTFYRQNGMKKAYPSITMCINNNLAKGLTIIIVLNLLSLEL